MSAPGGSLLDPLGVTSDAEHLVGDDAWLRALVDAELALARALVAAGLAPQWMSGVCEAIADASSLDLAAITREARGGGNPVIPLVKHLAREAESVRSGASDHLHVGTTSQDILDTAAMLVATRSGKEVVEVLGRLGDTLAALAQEHRATAMAGRTLGQQATPTSFGLVAAGWLGAVTDARARLAGVVDSLPAQLGGAIGSQAVLTELARSRRPDAAADEVVATVTRAYAAELGLACPAQAWQTNRLPIVAAGDAFAAATEAVGRIALEVTVLARTEIAEVSERLGKGEGGSSAMPHKRNPVTAVLIVAAARRTPGLVATLHASMLAEDQRPSGAWHAEWEPLRELERLALTAAGAAASLATRLDVDAERMRANLELTDGLIFSEMATTVLAEALGKRAAFDLVEQSSREAAETRRPLRVVLSGRLSADGHDDMLRERVWDAFDPARNLGQANAIVAREVARHTGDDAAERQAKP